MQLSFLRVLFLTIVISASGTVPVKGQRQVSDGGYFVEAEDFQFKGGWVVSNEGGLNSGSGILKSLPLPPRAADAITVVSIQKPGLYFVWTRSRDYPHNNPASRKYILYVNEQPMQHESGIHAKKDYYWEKTGSLQISKGEAVLRLKDVGTGYARCDAVFMTTDTIDLNTVDLMTLQKSKIHPEKITLSSTVPPAPEFNTINNDSKVLRQLTGNKIRLRFIEVRDNNGNKRIICKAELLLKDRWTDIDKNKEDHRIFLLRNDTAAVTFNRFLPFWKSSRNKASFISGGKKVLVDLPDDPFLAGDLLPCTPVSIKQLSDQELSVVYTIPNGDTVMGNWRLTSLASHYDITLHYKASMSGYYSFVVTAFQGVSPEKVQEVQLPPMFQYQRVPGFPMMIPSAVTPHPMAIVEMQGKELPVSIFIAGTLSGFPQDWASVIHSPMGFSLKNEMNHVQPVAFSPILGLEDSRLLRGQSIQRSFNIGIMNTDWRGVMEYISDSVYQVKDYRTQTGTSLTNSIFNTIDLIKNDSASGWDPELKGFYDIEADPKIAPTVAQVAPLAILSAAVITQDEDLYIQRALPSIEYTLSRSAVRWSKAIGTPFNANAHSLQLSPFSPAFNTAYFEALYRLLGNANPWLEKLALPNAGIRSKGVPSWTQELAAYRLTHDKAWLNKAVKNARQFIKEDVNGIKTDLIGMDAFYNLSFYPYWWDLPDLYEITKNRAVLKAADKSAFYTIAGLRSYPEVMSGNQTIHQNNKFTGVPNIWWKGKQKYRLGVTGKKADIVQKETLAAGVSPVGLGIEQPLTFSLDPAQPVWHILLSNWSPDLLRLSQYINRPLYEIYARNGVIGRFANYPGYYATGFSDLTMRADYPYKGPDVNSIYYHHIPAHLAFSIDFLMTEMTKRSKGTISFPWGKQEGFFWFNNRIYGGGTGTVMKDKDVRLWMQRDLIEINKPEINYVTGLSKDRFWVILLNEQASDLESVIKISKNVPVASDVAADVYKEFNGQPYKIMMKDRQLNMTTPGKGLIAFSFPLTTNEKEQQLPAIANGMQTLDVGPPWGKLYVFRIRSPFGWDSMFAYLTASPLKNTEAELIINDSSNALSRKSDYPYEWSLHSIPPQEDVNIKLKLKSASGERNFIMSFKGINQ